MRKYVRMFRKQHSEHIAQSTAGDVPSKPQSPDELAQWFGCSRRFIEGEVAAGRLRARKISPRLVRFMPSDIAAWLARSSTMEVDA
jgi:excisionase family DNA binding protein